MGPSARMRIGFGGRIRSASIATAIVCAALAAADCQGNIAQKSMSLRGMLLHKPLRIFVRLTGISLETGGWERAGHLPMKHFGAEGAPHFTSRRGGVQHQVSRLWL